MSTDPAGAALAVIDMARNGQFAELCERFAPPLRDMVSAGSLRAAWEAEVTPYGPVTEVRTPLTEAGAPGLTTARVPVTFERGELTIVTRGGAGEVEVRVHDSGGGVPAAVCERLFEPFFTTKPEGLGMGLSISRSIVEAHGGRMWVEPLEGSGATFSFTLPVADA